MKERIVVGYSSHKDAAYINGFIKQVAKSSGLNAKKGEIVFIGVQNPGSISLTKAYNTIWESAKDIPNSICVFVHHDIIFKSQSWGRNLLNIFNNYNVDILGVAGSEVLYPHCVWWNNHTGTQMSSILWGKVWHKLGNKPEYVSNFSGYRKCAKVQPAVVVDGLFIAANLENCLPFDEDFDGFHFYDISFCLKNFIAGKKIGITENIQITHMSGGNLSPEWEVNRQKLAEKYADAFQNGAIRATEGEIKE